MFYKFLAIIRHTLPTLRRYTLNFQVAIRKLLYFEKSYNKNYLFVLALYVRSADNESLKARIHDRFHKNLLNMFNTKFDFFKVTPVAGTSIKDFVEANFEKYIGNTYHTDGADFTWFAFDHGSTDLRTLQTETRVLCLSVTNTASLTKW